MNKYVVYSGGVEHVIDRYADALRENGYRVVVLGQAPAQGEALARFASLADELVMISAVVTHSPRDAARFLERAIYGSEAKAEVQKILRVQDLAVAFVFHAYHQVGFAFVNLLRAAGIPRVLSIHDYKIACTNYRFFDSKSGELCMDCLGSARAFLGRPVRNRCAGGSLAQSGALVVESVAQRIRRTYREGFDRVIVLNSLQRDVAKFAGVAPSRVVVLPNAVDRASVRVLGGVESGPALYVGRLSSEKGVDVAVRASSACGIPLRIVGDGPERAALEALARDLSAPVSFAGWLSHDQIVAEMVRARLLVVPSLWPEVFPLVVCEAMSAGLPVVGSDVGGMSDLLAEERGFLVAPGDVASMAATWKNLSPSSAVSRATTAQRHADSELSPATWRSRFTRILQDVVIDVPRAGKGG